MPSEQLEKGGKVFLSYSHADSDVARALAESLRESGVGIRLEDEMPAGEDWRANIRDAMSTSSAIIVLIGDGASQHQRTEWTMALDSSFEDGRPIVPVLISDAAPPAWAEQFEVLKVPHHGGDQSDWPDVVSNIRRSLSRVRTNDKSTIKRWGALRNRLDAVVREAQALDE